MESPRLKAGRSLVFVLGIGLAASACETDARPAAAPAAAGLPPYTAAEASLFDDNFSPDFFGLERSSAPGEDSKLRARIHGGTAVVPTRISTVTRDKSGESASYTLVLQPSAAPLAGQWEPGPVGIGVDGRSPSFALIRSLDEGLVGMAVILFVKRYNDGGAQTIHWHAEPDTEAVRQAVMQASLLAEIR